MFKPGRRQSEGPRWLGMVGPWKKRKRPFSLWGPTSNWKGFYKIMAKYSPSSPSPGALRPACRRVSYVTSTGPPQAKQAWKSEDTKSSQSWCIAIFSIKLHSKHFEICIHTKPVWKILVFGGFERGVLLSSKRSRKWRAKFNFYKMGLMKRRTGDPTHPPCPLLHIFQPSHRTLHVIFVSLWKISLLGKKVFVIHPGALRIGFSAIPNNFPKHTKNPGENFSHMQPLYPGYDKMRGLFE